MHLTCGCANIHTHTCSDTQKHTCMHPHINELNKQPCTALVNAAEWLRLRLHSSALPTTVSLWEHTADCWVTCTNSDLRDEVQIHKLGQQRAPCPFTCSKDVRGNCQIYNRFSTHFALVWKNIYLATLKYYLVQQHITMSLQQQQNKKPKYYFKISSN